MIRSLGAHAARSRLDLCAQRVECGDAVENVFGFEVDAEVV
jgi:hypothetical protein